jgi:tetratricopeptide (TPR) repeat protein
MYCWHCGKRLREDGEFCSACGMIVVKPAEESGKTEAAEQKVHTLLAEANLLRLRKEWQAAILRCTEALKIAPNSASAHSLLGDICRDEGRPREAMEWYRQALTLEPTRRLDREKLDALIDLTYGSERGGEEGALLSRELSKRRMWMDSGLRIAVSALAAVIFVALSAFLLNYPYSQKTLTELPAPTLIPRPARPVSPEQDADREIQTLPQQTEVPVALLRLFCPARAEARQPQRPASRRLRLSRRERRKASPSGKSDWRRRFPGRRRTRARGLNSSG